MDLTSLVVLTWLIWFDDKADNDELDADDNDSDEEKADSTDEFDDCGESRTVLLIVFDEDLSGIADGLCCEFWKWWW